MEGWLIPNTVHKHAVQLRLVQTTNNANMQTAGTSDSGELSDEARLLQKMYLRSRNIEDIAKTLPPIQ